MDSVDLLALTSKHDMAQGVPWSVLKELEFFIRSHCRIKMFGSAANFERTAVPHRTQGTNGWRTSVLRNRIPAITA